MLVRGLLVFMVLSLTPHLWAGLCSETLAPKTIFDPVGSFADNELVYLAFYDEVKQSEDPMSRNPEVTLRRFSKLDIDRQTEIVDGVVERLALLIPYQITEGNMLRLQKIAENLNTNYSVLEDFLADWKNLAANELKLTTIKQYLLAFFRRGGKSALGTMFPDALRNRSSLLARVARRFLGPPTTFRHPVGPKTADANRIWLETPFEDDQMDHLLRLPPSHQWNYAGPYLNVMTATQLREVLDTLPPGPQALRQQIEARMNVIGRLKESPLPSSLEDWSDSQAPLDKGELTILDTSLEKFGEYTDSDRNRVFERLVKHYIFRLSQEKFVEFAESWLNKDYFADNEERVAALEKFWEWKRLYFLDSANQQKILTAVDSLFAEIDDTDWNEAAAKIVQRSWAYNETAAKNQLDAIRRAATHRQTPGAPDLIPVIQF